MFVAAPSASSLLSPVSRFIYSFMGRERRPLLKDIQEKRLDFSAFHGAH